ncbi:MAG: hypothetical protein ABWY57_14890, partial [Mycetocola sp.]
ILGAFIVTGAAINILVLLVSGMIGYGLRKLDVPLAPIALTMVLGKILEENLVRALLLSDGDVTTLVASPFSAILMGIAILALVGPPLFRLSTRIRRRTLAAQNALVYAGPNESDSDVSDPDSSPTASPALTSTSRSTTPHSKENM